MYPPKNYVYKDIKRAKQRAKQRLFNRIYDLVIDRNCLFLTFTFTNQTLRKTNKQTRLRYIKQFLNEQTTDYILNIDYGEKNKREHYHAIIKPIIKKMVYTKPFKYGAIQITFLRIDQDIKALVNNLLNHATKETTNKNRLIYSRTAKRIKYNPYGRQLEMIKANKQREKLNDEIRKILLSDEEKLFNIYDPFVN